VSLAVSLLLLALVVGVVVKLWVSQTEKPPRFVVETGAARNEAGLFYLPFTLINEGDKTAAEVMVEGTIGASGKEETSSTTFDFIPGRSRQKGELVFSADPASAQVRVTSYQQP
jgi:uncharacterized protein (TIGR02588 family)